MTSPRWPASIVRWRSSTWSDWWLSATCKSSAAGVWSASRPRSIASPPARFKSAEALAQSFQRLGDRGNQAIREAGRSFGLGLGRAGSRSILGALEPLSEMGGEYEVDRGGTIACTNCLFAEVCRRTPIICSFHAGLIGGLLERSGLEPEVEALGPRDPDGCAYAVHPREQALPARTAEMAP